MSPHLKQLFLTNAEKLMDLYPNLTPLEAQELLAALMMEKINNLPPHPTETLN